MFQRSPAAHKQIPNGHRQLPSDGRHHQLDFSLAPQQFAAPFSERTLRGAQDRLRSFYQQAAQIGPPMASDAPAPLALTAVVKGGIEPDILDQLGRTAKALDVSNERAHGN